MSKRGPSTQPGVLKSISERAGRTVHVETVMKETGFTKSQIQNAAHDLIRKGLIVTVLAGNAWRFVPPEQREQPREVEPEKTSPMVYEQRGVAGNGDHIIEDVNGVLYRAVAL